MHFNYNGRLECKNPMMRDNPIEMVPTDMICSHLDHPPTVVYRLYPEEWCICAYRIVQVLRARGLYALDAAVERTEVWV